MLHPPSIPPVILLTPLTPSNPLHPPALCSSFLPCFNHFLKARSQCWCEAVQYPYNDFHDYSNIVIQFCFVLFFSEVFPLAPLVALLNNIVLIRLMAYKICYTRQRPIAQKTSGLGVWEDVLQIMSVVGILTNCGVLGYTSKQLRLSLIPAIGSSIPTTSPGDSVYYDS